MRPNIPRASLLAAQTNVFLWSAFNLTEAILKILFYLIPFTKKRFTLWGAQCVEAACLCDALPADELRFLVRIKESKGDWTDSIFMWKKLFPNNKRMVPYRYQSSKSITKTDSPPIRPFIIISLPSVYAFIKTVAGSDAYIFVGI